MKTIDNSKRHVRREVLTASPGLHVRETGDGEGQGRIIEGYAICFGVPSEPLWADARNEAREVIAPEAITREALDGSDIKFTMFHDRQLILARSNKGKGTLSYEVDEHGVKFSFEAPSTIDGDKAIELVRRGDISGCSFAFSTYYDDSKYVEHTSEKCDGKTLHTYTVRAVTGIYDFTLAADPAYPATEVEAREFLAAIHGEDEAAAEGKRQQHIERYVEDMQRVSRQKIL